MGTILLFEPNAHHYEVIPGFVYYFLELGYKVDCLVQEHPSYGDEFCLLPKTKAKINYIFFHPEDIPHLIEILTTKKEYDFLFCSSFDYWVDDRMTSIYEIIKYADHSKYGVVGCYHAMKYFRKHNFEELDRSRVVTLSPVAENDYLFPMVNANYFTEEEKAYRKNEHTKLACIGVSNDNNELRSAVNKIYHESKASCEIVFLGGKSGKELKKSQTKKRLLFPIIKLLNIEKYNNEGYAPFPKIDKAIEEEIRILGRVTFEKMFEEIISSDFIVVNIAQRLGAEFSTEKTTGSKQLSLGFCKPTIIEETYAQYFGFSEENAVIYKKGELSEGIKRAIVMTNEEYHIMINELRKLQNKIRAESKNNLRRCLESLKSR